ncbi:hypothetical protein UCRPC4_g03249 [Phaeomoniella chlamydospora]|uniref:Uncharacterized protein n=1 Tax=Phaeomoniella chlamydospora TaxID=158046 RepID=A0A0G2EKB7_PHACM|nr:hypothetical protein UCRPC4_g03249 [Phaeomoniella chlamydospora]
MWPALGQKPHDLEVHIAQIGADARKLLRHRNQGAVPFAVLSPLLMSCIEVAKKYSQEVSKGVDIPGQTNSSTSQGQIFQPVRNAINILEEDSDHDDASHNQHTAPQMNMTSAFQHFAEEAAAFADLTPTLLQAPGTANALLQHTAVPVDPNWPDRGAKPRMVSMEKLRKIESTLTNMLATAKPNKGIPADGRHVRTWQLKSGAFSIRTASSQGIDHLVDNIKKWSDLFGQSAQIYIPTYSVKIYSIKRGSFCDANGQLMDEPSVLNALINTGGPTTPYLLPGSVSAMTTTMTKTCLIDHILKRIL